MKLRKCASDVCDVLFIPERDSQAYCCDECKKYMRKKQKKDWYKRSKLSKQNEPDTQTLSENVKTNCFAWDEDRKNCKALSKIECLHGSCPFYKPMEKHLQDVKRTKIKLANK